jgi:hypothetical protein
LVSTRSFLVLTIALVGSLIFFGLYELVTEPPPGDKVDLSAAPWTILEVHDEPVTSSLTMTFRELTGFGEFAFACGTLRFRFNTDSDGEAFNMREVAYEGEHCADAENIRSVLPRVREWRAPSSTTIEFWDEDGKTVISAARGVSSQPPST